MSDSYTMITALQNDVINYIDEGNQITEEWISNWEYDHRGYFDCLGTDYHCSFRYVLTDENLNVIENDDMEVLEDMLKIAINNAFVEIDKEAEKVMGPYGNALNGLF